MPRKMTIAERFAKYAKPTDTECIEWTGTITPNGYGWLHIRRNGERGGVSAHRAAYELHIGPIPVGLMVLHRCDNRRCVNPDHLMIGTQGDNMRDCAAKGRTVWRDSPNRRGRKGLRGESNGNAKLTLQDVAGIRAAVARGESKLSTAKRFNISDTHVGRIVSGVWG